MMEAFYPLLALTAAMFLVFGLLSRPLQRGIVTAPMLCVAVGALAAQALGTHASIALDNPVIGAIGEIALAIILFTDAGGVDRARLRREWQLPARLLAIGLPLTVVAGIFAGLWLFPELPWVWLGVMAVILAPTDAALGIAVLLNDAVPWRVRDALNVESGLNDGLVVPPLMALLAAAAAATPTVAAEEGWVLDAARELVLGAVIGVLFGVLAGRILDTAWKRGWIDETFARLVTPGLAVLTFVAAHLLDQNGFVAVYVAGLTLAVRSPDFRERLREFGEADGTQFSLFVFLLFGFAMVPAAVPYWDLPALVYALVSLTLVRMLPVWISLAGSGLDLRGALFIGWSGPRGIASVLYLAIVVQRFGVVGHERLFGVIVLTVMLSVFLHGVSASPLSALYGRSVRRKTND